jgi:hypothetical protein
VNAQWTSLWKENIHETSAQTLIPVELLSTVTVLSPTETGPPHSDWYKTAGLVAVHPTSPHFFFLKLSDRPELC